MKVTDDVLEVLGEGRAEGNLFFLGPRQLERPLYERVDKVLKAAGGKWNRSKRAHIFEDPADEALDPIWTTGEITDAKKEFQFFESPAPVVNRILQLAQIGGEHRVLEPSAGRGAIALQAAILAKEVVAIELQERNCAYLRTHAPHNMEVHGPVDFLSIEPAEPYFHRVVMNPPFARRADIHHIMRAREWLAPGGRLVSVAGAGVKFRDDRPGRAFREFVEAHNGTIEDLPLDSFKVSGTGVSTVLVTLAP